MRDPARGWMLVIGLLAVGALQPTGRADALAYWRFEELPGDLGAVDDSGAGHVGTLENMNIGADDGTSGRSEQVPGGWVVADGATNANLRSLRFDGTNDFIEITGNLPGFDLTNNPSAFTVELFFKLHSDDFPMRFLDMIRTNDSSPGTVISAFLHTFDPVPGQAISTEDDNTTEYETVYPSINLEPTPITYQTWHHIAFVKDGSNMTFYIDYQKEATRKSSAIPGPFTGFQRVRIGALQPHSNPFEGFLDEVRFSNQALNPSEFLRVVGGLAPAIRAMSVSSNDVDVLFVSQSGTVYAVESAPAALPGQDDFEWTTHAAAVTGKWFYTTYTTDGSADSLMLRVQRLP